MSKGWTLLHSHKVEEMFGPLVGKNSYRYNHIGDEELCK